MTGERRTWPRPTPIDDTEATAGAVRVPMRLLDKLLLVIVVGLLLAVGTLTFFVVQQQRYNEGEGEQAERARARIREEIRQSWCTALDTLPQGGYGLDLLREKYGCGPGKPLDELPPEVAEQLRRDRPPEPAPQAVAPQAPPVVPPSVAGGAVPNPPAKAERAPAPPAEPEPEPAPAPAAPEPAPTDLTAPVVGLVCDLIPC